LEYLSGFTRTRNTQVPVSVSQSVSESQKDTGAASGSNLFQAKDQSSSSVFPAEEGSGTVPLLVLVLEDNRADLLLVREAVELYDLKLDIEAVSDGDMAVQFIDRLDENLEARCPSLILLDLNVPVKSGTEVLRHLRESQRCAHVPVLIMTSSDSPADRSETSRLGADGYFRKPLSYDDFMKIGEEMRKLLPQAPRASS
jgi:CheY-like chemotaxis protein